MLACSTLLGCGGCATSGVKPPREKKSAVWELSPGAQSTYAYLVYEQALRQDEEAVLLRAVEALAAYEPPVHVYVETSVRLLGHKSPASLQVLERGLQHFPGNISLNLLYAEALQEQGRTIQAVKHMRGYVKEHPDSVDAKLEMALLLVKNNQPTEAEKLLKGIKGEQRTAMVEYYHARALIGMRREADAAKHLRKALKLMPDFVEAMAELAYIHEQRGELREAHALYESILKNNDGGQDVLLRLVSLSLRLRQPQKAVEFARRGPDATAFKATVAGMFVEARQYDFAEPLLESLLNASDVPADMCLHLAAIVYESRKDAVMAMKWLEKVSPESPGYVKACLLRAQLLADGKKFDEALTVLRAGGEQARNKKEFRDMEIRLLASAQRLPDALKEADKAVALWPEDSELAFLRASLLEESGDKSGAMQAMEAIIAGNPDHFQALNYVGYTLAEQNHDLGRALQLLHRAVELSPKSAYILDSLAWAQFRAGQLQAAWESINKAVALDVTQDPTIWEHYGDIAVAIGKKAEARKGYNNALELNSPNVQSLRRRLSEL